jgi:hypothetical protein
MGSFIAPIARTIFLSRHFLMTLIETMCPAALHAKSRLTTRPVLTLLSTAAWLLEIKLDYRESIPKLNPSVLI